MTHWFESLNATSRLMMSFSLLAHDAKQASRLASTSKDGAENGKGAVGHTITAMEEINVASAKDVLHYLDHRVNRLSDNKLRRQPSRSAKRQTALVRAPSPRVDLHVQGSELEVPVSLLTPRSHGKVAVDSSFEEF